MVGLTDQVDGRARPPLRVTGDLLSGAPEVTGLQLDGEVPHADVLGNIRQKGVAGMPLDKSYVYVYAPDDPLPAKQKKKKKKKKKKTKTKTKRKEEEEE